MRNSRIIAAFGFALVLGLGMAPSLLASEPCSVLSDFECKFVGRIGSLPIQYSRSQTPPADPARELKERVNSIHSELLKLTDTSSSSGTDARILSKIEARKSALEKIRANASAARDRFEETSIYDAKAFFVGLSQEGGSLAVSGKDDFGWDCNQDGIQIDRRDADEVLQKLKYIPDASDRYKQHIEALIAAHDPRLRDGLQVRKYGIPQFLSENCKFLWELDGINSEVSLRRQESEHSIQLYGPMSAPKTVLGLLKKAFSNLQSSPSSSNREPSSRTSEAR